MYKNYHKEIRIEHQGKFIPGKNVFGKEFPLAIPDILCELNVLKSNFPHNVDKLLEMYKFLYERYYEGYVWNHYEELYITTSLELMNKFLKKDNAKDNQFLCLLGPSNVGKTFRGTAFFNWHYLMDPTNTKILLTSNKVDSTRQRIWNDYINRFKDVRKHYPDLYNEKDWRIHDSRANMQLKYIGSDNKCVVTAASLNKERGEEKTIDSIIGIHGINYFILIDEATSCSIAIHGAKENLANNKLCQIQLSGNPNDPHNLLGHTARPELGYDGFDWDKNDTYENNYGTHIYFNPEKSPAIMHPDPEVRRKLALLKYPTIEKMAEAKERFPDPNDPDYFRFVLGRIQLTAKDAGVLSTKTIDMYDLTKVVEFSPYTDIIKTAGFDPSLGYTNSDESPFFVARIGVALDGFTKICFGGGKLPYLHKLKGTLNSDLPPLYQMVMKAKDIAKEHNIDPKFIGCDIKPLGIKDIIHREWTSDVRIIDGGSSPQGEVKKTKGIIRFANKITECYYQIKQFGEAGLIGGLPEEVIKFLLARKFIEKNGRISLEAKDEFVKRTKLGSPDVLDAIAYNLDTAIWAAGLRLQKTTTEQIQKKKDDWNLQEKTANPLRTETKPIPKGFKLTEIRTTSFSKRRRLR